MRTAAAIAVILLCSCGDDGSAAGGTTQDSSSSSGEPGTVSSVATTEPSSSSTADSDASSSGGPSDPPTDADFEWDEVEPLDCGERGHVVHESGPTHNRINLVILGDGYTIAELDDSYVDHVDRFLYAMFGPDGFPYDVYTQSFNICRIDVVSAESGTDFPAQGIEVDTAMDSWGDTTTRLAQIVIAEVDAQLDDALASSNVAADWVAVTVNTELWIGSGGYPMLWSGGHETAEIGVHEGGHSFHDLADEYSEGNGAYMGGEPGEVNVTADLRSDKWAAWLGFDQDDVGVIDFYEGARYFDAGIWRPSFEGRMRDVTRSHNAPSIDKMIRDMYAIAGPIDDVSPKVEGQYPPALGLRVVDESLVEVDWEVDGEVVLASAGPRIWTAELELDAGAHEVTAVVRDPTEWVRAEDRSVLEMRATWQLAVPANLEHTLALAASAPSQADERTMVLRAPPAIHSARSHGHPHALGPKRVHAIAANAELLRARDDLVAGRLAEARQRLRAHATTFGPLHATDRDQLTAALECTAGTPAPSPVLVAHPRRRFAKLLSACQDAERIAARGRSESDDHGAQGSGERRDRKRSRSEATGRRATWLASEPGWLDGGRQAPQK